MYIGTCWSCDWGLCLLSLFHARCFDWGCCKIHTYRDSSQAFLCFLCFTFGRCFKLSLFTNDDVFNVFRAPNKLPDVVVLSPPAPLPNFNGESSVVGTAVIACLSFSSLRFDVHMPMVKLQQPTRFSKRRESRSTFLVLEENKNREVKRKGLRYNLRLTLTQFCGGPRTRAVLRFSK